MTEEKQTNEAKVVEVSTATAEAIQLPNGTIANTNDMLVLIYNKLISMEKKL